MKHKFSVKWSVFFHLTVFVGILLLCMWLFQTVYLDEFYKMIKTNDLEEALEKMEELIDEEELENAVAAVADSYDICILITDTYGNKLYSQERNTRCAIHKLSKSELLRVMEKAQSSGSVIRIKDNKGLFIDTDGERPYSDEKVNSEENRMQDDFGSRDKFADMMGMPEAEETESLILAKSITDEDGCEYYVLLDSHITPVSATVYTLRVQLVYISCIMVLIAMIVAVAISIWISKPIVKINKTAKRMAQGDYSVNYDDGNYKEISELSKTLNYTVGELKKTDDLQREIIANVSHDLRTPLTMITAYSEVMRDLPGENTPENVQVIIDEAKRLTNLVNDMLDISKLQAGVSTLDAEEYNLTSGIKSIIDRYAKLVEQDGYKVTFEYKEENVWVYGDEFKLYQVLYNLINNAINYTGVNKDVTIRQIVNGKIVRIEVIDSGEGIAKEELENVWERYYKVDKEHKRAVMGTGLGLSIVKNILKLHNAKFGVMSEVGVGSTFWFELKIIDEKAMK